MNGSVNSALRGDDTEVVWSFDLNEMHRHLSADDALQSTMRTHLYIDHIIIEILKLAMPRNGLVRFARMNFLVKAEVAVGLGALNPAHLPSVKRLNDMRNRMAHDINGQISDIDRQKLYDSLSEFSQEIARRPTERGPRQHPSEVSLQRIFKTMVVSVDLDRWHYALFVEQRRKAFENARKVLSDIDNGVIAASAARDTALKSAHTGSSE